MSNLTKITLRRTSADSQCREVVGAVCQRKEPWQCEPCGGTLGVRDLHGVVDDPEGRYELFCELCQVCDPNGYRTLREAREAAVRFGLKEATP